MNLYLVAGPNPEMIKKSLEKTGEIVVVRCENSIGEALDYLIKNKLDYDTILLTDQGIVYQYENFEKLIVRFKEFLENTSYKQEFKFITKEPQYESAFKKVAGNDTRFVVYFTDQVRISATELVKFCLEGYERETGGVSKALDEVGMTSGNDFKKSRSFLDRFKMSSRKERDTKEVLENHDKDLQYLRKSKNGGNSIFAQDLRKVVVITGHRGSGVSSTTANLATLASSQGLTTMIVDMDTLYRGMNLYFSKFGEEVEINPDLSYSLIRCLMKPDSYAVNSCTINQTLSVITLTYSISGKDRLFDAIEFRRLLSLIALLRLNFNLVILDFPIDFIKQHSDIVTQVDSIGICLNNSLYSIINTAKSLEENILKDELLFRTKSRVIVTSFNENNQHHGKILSLELTCDILNELTSVSDAVYKGIGIIPYSKDFDLQISLGERICSTNSSYRKYYSDILKGLI